MSNLSELLPTGGGQNAVDFVASGTLSSGQTVVLNSDGTVKAAGLESIPENIGSETNFSAAQTQFIGSVYDPDNDKIVIAYMDQGDSSKGKAVVATISGASLSFGTPVEFNANPGEIKNLVYDSGSDVVLLAFDESYAYPSTIVGVVSGTSISFGTRVRASTSANPNYPSSIVYDSVENKFVIFYQDTTSFQNYTKCKVGSVSGTTITYGSEVTAVSSNSQEAACVYDESSGKVVLVYRNNLSGYIECKIGTISGTSISFGTAVVVESSNIRYPTVVYDSSNSKVIIGYSTVSGPYYGYARIGTVSGTSISVGSAISFNTTGRTYDNRSVYDSGAGKVVFAWKDGTSPNYGKLATGTTSASSISFGSVSTFNSGSTLYISLSYSPIDRKVLISYEDISASQYGKSLLFTNSQSVSNTTDFIGITSEAISDTATGAVNVYGGINEAQTGLTIGSDYYVQDDGSLSTTASDVKVGQAISATTINMMDLT